MVDFDIKYSTLQTEVEPHGCYTSDDSSITVLEKDDILLQYISEWSFLVIIPILTIIMIFAGV